MSTLRATLIGFSAVLMWSLLAVITSDGRHYWAVTDHRGSVLALVDERGAVAARYRYTPHGAVTASGAAAAVNPFRFLGAYQLRRSAHLLDHRLYNGFWGRFTQPDPTRRSYAPYTFRDNDPVNVGTWTRHDFWAALAGPPERAVDAFLPALPEPDRRQAHEPDGSAGPGVAPDRTPLIADEPATRFPLIAADCRRSSRGTSAHAPITGPSPLRLGRRRNLINGPGVHPRGVYISLQDADG